MHAYISNDRIKILPLDRQPSNALDLLFLKELRNQIKAIEHDDSIQCVIMTSKCRTIFSSGLDLSSLTDCKSREMRIRILKAVWCVHGIVKQIMNSKKIYIAALNGAVIGSAVSIVMACDFIFAHKNAWFWLPDPQYGGLLADGGLDIIKMTVGIPNAKRIGMTNERIIAQDAKDMGIINHIVDNGCVKDFVQSFATDLLQHAFPTLQKTKAIINKGVLNRFQLIPFIQIVFSKELPKRLKKYDLGKR